MKRRICRPRRRGFAVFLVIMVSLVLAAFAAILWTQGGRSRGDIALVVEDKQADYLARGAQQHALLKFKLLPNELYDAVAFAVGKNPTYDFARPHSTDEPATKKEINRLDAESCPGPMFFTGKSSTIIKAVKGKDASGGTSYFINVDRSKNKYTSGDTGLSGGEDEIRANMRKLLNSYLVDIATLYPTDDEKGIIVIDSKAHDDKAFGSGWRDPFVANYMVADLTILGAKKSDRMQRDSVSLTTVASVKRGDQISIVTELGGQPKNLSQLRKMMNELKYGQNEFAEARRYLESKEGYDERMGLGMTEPKGNKAIIEAKVGRATRLTTGVFAVSRKSVQ